MLRKSKSKVKSSEPGSAANAKVGSGASPARRGRRGKPAAFTLAHPNAAGIDIGGSQHFVAVPADRDSAPVRQFTSFTDDLGKMADWLASCGIDTVAMESTGVYWIPVFELLERRGFVVFLVNARHVKSVSGRKSDVLDCQWLQQLMSYGLLAAAYRPAGKICAVRAIMRQRTMLLRMQASHIQHMQKALTQMNIQLGNVISDIVGLTGQRIIRAILAGERDGNRLAKLRDCRVKASEAEVARALVGTWRDEHLFALGQAVALFDAYAGQIAACDAKLDSMLAALATREDEPGPDKRNGRRPKNAPKFDARARLYRLCGVDLTRIDGIDTSTALKVVSEIGPDLSRFKTVKHFTSWLKLCPGTKISGCKVLSARTGHSGSPAAQALRLAAAALRNSQSSLGAYYRRMAARMDTPATITAVAHKLARLVYTMLTQGAEYVDKGIEYEEARHRDRQLRNLAQKAKSLGFTLAPQAAVS